MTEEAVTDRSEHQLPFGRTVTLKNVAHDSGLKMLRLTIREGRRFTIIDLDAGSAGALGGDLLDWVNENSDNS